MERSSTFVTVVDSWSKWFFLEAYFLSLPYIWQGLKYIFEHNILTWALFFTSFCFLVIVTFSYITLQLAVLLGTVNGFLAYPFLPALRGLSLAFLTINLLEKLGPFLILPPHSLPLPYPSHSLSLYQHDVSAAERSCYSIIQLQFSLLQEQICGYVSFIIKQGGKVFHCFLGSILSLQNKTKLTKYIELPLLCNGNSLQDQKVQASSI